MRILLTTTYNLSTLVQFDGTNGNYPTSGLIVNSAGDVFGTTAYGGVGFNGSSNPGYGTVFELVKNGANYTLSTLVELDGPDGYDPFDKGGGLVMDSSGDLYGTTTENLNEFGGVFGTVFEAVKVGNSYSLSTLVQFTGTSQGNDPQDALMMDSSGDLFGTNSYGIFELTKTGSGFAFSYPLAGFGGSNGSSGRLVMDSQGDLFGTSSAGAGKNLVFEAVNEGGGRYTPVDLITFTGGISDLAIDPSGNLYGTRYTLNQGDGSVFELVKNGGSYTQETLATFTGSNGINPEGGLTLDGSGNVFGVTQAGGSLGYGTAYEIAAGSGTITTLANCDASSSPGTNLFMDNEGNLYGAADYGGSQGLGSVFKLSPILHLAFASQPTSTVAGSLVNQVVVNVEDASNNIFVDYDARASLTASPAPGNLGGTVSNTVINGVVIFKQCLEFINSGTYQLTASDSSGDTGATSNSFSITPAAAKKLVFAAGPTNISAGQIYNPPVVVYVMDQFGNIVRNVNSAVTLSVHSGPVGGTLHGTATVNLNNGAAIFSNVSLQTLGNYTLTAADGALTAITSPTFSVAAATASKLVFTTIPTTGTHGVNFTVKVSVEDAFGNVLTSQNSGTITLALATHPTGSFLTGILTVNVVNGVASFVNLSVNFAGTYTLQASDNFGVGAATSGSIVVS